MVAILEIKGEEMKRTKLMEILEEENGTRFLIVKQRHRVFHIPPFEWQIEEKEDRIKLIEEYDAIKFMLDYFHGLELKESRKILPDKFGTTIEFKFCQKGKKNV